MPFFDRERPRNDEDEELDDEFGGLPASGRWLGGVVPVEEFVGRNDSGAVAIRRIVAYPEGFELEVVAWLRARRRGRGRRFGPQIDLTPFAFGRNDDELSDDLVRFGIEFPDGAKVTNLDDTWRVSPDATEPMHGLESRAGSGSELEQSQEFYVWPLPGAGTVRFVCEWPGVGLGESSLELDGALFEDAASRARPVWADDPGVSHLTRHSTARFMAQRHGIDDA